MCHLQAEIFSYSVIRNSLDFFSPAFFLRAIRADLEDHRWSADHNLKSAVIRVMTPHNARTSGTSGDLTIASLQRLKMEDLIPAPRTTHKEKFSGFPGQNSFFKIYEIKFYYALITKLRYACIYF